MADFDSALKELEDLEASVDEAVDWSDERAREFLDVEGKFLVQARQDQPDSEPSQLGACINFMHELRGLPFDKAERICGWINVPFSDIVGGIERKPVGDEEL